MKKVWVMQYAVPKATLDQRIADFKLSTAFISSKASIAIGEDIKQHVYKVQACTNVFLISANSSFEKDDAEKLGNLAFRCLEK
jgi:hypothetical protein